MPVQRTRFWRPITGLIAGSMILTACQSGVSWAEETPLAAPAGREELMRRFDVNHDGHIDPSEAEVARSKMRRERSDAARSSSLDPLTGRPRNESATGQAQRPGGMQKPVTSELPGSPQQPAAERPKTGSSTEDGNRSRTPRPQPKNANAGQPPSSPQRPGAATGGVRAGAPAVRPGYGGPGGSEPLNAGRPIPPRMPLLRQLPGGPASAPSRSQFPAPTGSNRPARPQPPISAEEMGR